MVRILRRRAGLLSRLLRLELVQLHLLALDFSLLIGDLPLHILLLFLPGLQLIANQRAAEQSDSGADTGARAGMTRSAADNRAQTSAGESADAGAFLSRRQRFRTAEKNHHR